mmetsp:Transcript_20360/g.43636  ORF Transcript_20360/g.43636 Transcript_20360/m.43636 type:complete len:343 (+) Transcript_20360:839-1867(+)
MPYPDLELETWYARRGDVHDYVNIIHFPRAPVQKAAYDRCLRRDAKNNTFAGLFDIDEFLVLRKHNNVVDFVEDHCDEDCGQLGINWRVMSASLETSYRPVPVTKRNVHATNLAFHDTTVKVIVRPNYVVDDDMDWTHTVRLKRGSWIDTNGTVIPRPDRPTDHWSGKQTRSPSLTDVAQFYHYRFKSDEEYMWKVCQRGNSLHKLGEFPHCGGRMERIGMHNAESECGKHDEFAKLLLKKLVSKCGVRDDAPWRDLRRMVPKYVVYGDDAPLAVIGATDNHPSSSTIQNTQASEGPGAIHLQLSKAKEADRPGKRGHRVHVPQRSRHPPAPVQHGRQNTGR